MVLAMARPWKHPKTGIYWIRKRVPEDLRAQLGKREEKLTLKTRDPAAAKRLHAKALAELEQRWSNLRAPVRQLDQAALHQVTVTTYERCTAAGTPGIVWDTATGDTLWGDALDMGAAVQRNWSPLACRSKVRAAFCAPSPIALATLSKSSSATRRPKAVTYSPARWYWTNSASLSGIRMRSS